MVCFNGQNITLLRDFEQYPEQNSPCLYPTTMAIQKVLIIGAGPCGLLLALLLAKNGMTVEVLDKESRLDDSPRAAYYNWPAMVDLYRAGLGEDLRREAWYARSASWRTMQNERLFGLRTDEEQEKELLEEEAKGRPRPAVLPLRDLMRMMQKHIEQQDRVKLSFNHIVTGIGQDDSSAWVDVELIDGSAAKLAADYIVGCDGANSVIRRLLFGEKAFPGFTWPQTIVATNVSRSRIGPLDLHSTFARSPGLTAAFFSFQGILRLLQPWL